MPWWGWLLIIGVVIYLAIYFWQITLTIVLIGLAIWLIVYLLQKAKENNKKHAEEAARLEAWKAQQRVAEVEQKARQEAMIQRHIVEQGNYCREMLAIGKQSMTLYESMPKLLSLAELYLDQAEIDYSESAFAPFWDSVENAANTLGRLNESIGNIKNNSKQYTALAKKYEEAPPRFPLSNGAIDKLNIAKKTSDRMKGIVRNAQRNFQFAFIFEQRKTNKILIAGFTNLANALDTMTTKITASIYDLNDAVDGVNSTISEMNSNIDESIGEVGSKISDIATTNRQFYDDIREQSAESAAREKKTIEMLDNIQRGRKP